MLIILLINTFSNTTMQIDLINLCQFHNCSHSWVQISTYLGQNIQRLLSLDALFIVIKISRISSDEWRPAQQASKKQQQQSLADAALPSRRF
jgi:hypothetical protein